LLLQLPPRHQARQVAALYAAALITAAAALTAADAASFVKSAEPGPARPPAGARAPAPRAAPVQHAPAIAFEMPVKGEGVDSPFGLRRLPWEAFGRLHAGVDIAAAPGAPVHEVAEGLVLQAGRSPSYGNFVEILHPSGLKSLYAHMGRQSAGLTRGARLEKGRVIGFVGSTGRSTGAHLHFELRKGERPLNPQLFLGRGFTRLADLPIAQAARYPRRVHVAYVSRWPDSILRQREAKAAEARLAKAEHLRGKAAKDDLQLASADDAQAELMRATAATKAGPKATGPVSTPIEGVEITRTDNGRVRAVLTVGS
jgi:hypothetical protein